MSKIGFTPITVAQTVKIELTEKSISISGSKGSLSFDLPYFITVSMENDKLILNRKGDGKRQKSTHGLLRSLINNAVKGVDTGWSKRLEVVGTGYNVKMQGADANFKLGLSHPVIFKAPKGIQLTVEGNNIVIVSGYNKQQVGEVASQIKALKKKDAYKGKGLRYEGERVKLKPGKKAKA